MGDGGKVGAACEAVQLYTEEMDVELAVFSEADSVELKDRNGEVQSVYNLSQETWPKPSPYEARERPTGCAEGVIGATSVVEITPLVGLRGRDHG